MDELRSTIKEKTNRSLDLMVTKTDSPFTMAILECPVPSKFRLPQLEPFDGLKDPLDHLNIFKTTLGLQQPPDDILRRSFPTILKGAAREWFNVVHRQFRVARQFFPLSLHRRATSEKASRPFAYHQSRRKRDPEVICNAFHLRKFGGEGSR